MTHELKIKPEYFLEVMNGNKTFELRKNDRDYMVGDTIILKEFDEDYTGAQVERRISYLLMNCEEYGLMDGFVILGLKEIE